MKKNILNPDYNFGCAFTVDVEDGVSIAMRDVFGIQTEQTDRVVTNTNKILELLNQHNIKATFFVLGEVAETFPFLIKNIHKDGHEIGVHGYHHLQFFKMNRKQAVEELSAAKKLLEDLTGSEIIGHRAPAFTITPNTSWGLEVIADCGFKYDSSVMPVNSVKFGWKNFPKDISLLKIGDDKELIEVPISTTSLAGMQIPFSGGGYLRLLPFWFIKHAFQQHSKKRATIHYMHPYELDSTPYPDYYFEALKKATFFKQIKMRSFWLKRASVYHKLERLIAANKFSTIKNVIDEKFGNSEVQILYLNNKGFTNRVS